MQKIGHIRDIMAPKYRAKPIECSNKHELKKPIMVQKLATAMFPQGSS